MGNKFKVIILMFVLVLSVSYCAYSDDGSAKEKQTVAEKNTKVKHWPQWEKVKVAAAQVEIHTETQIDQIIKYIDRAGVDKAQMIVLGEYLLGPFHQDTSDAVKRVADAAQ